MQLINSDYGWTELLMEYDAFGNIVSQTGDADQENPFKFSTKYYDHEIEWYDFGRRFYIPAFGRFANRDPVEEWGGVNLYVFVGNDGNSRYDFIGMYELDVKPSSRSEVVGIPFSYANLPRNIGGQIGNWDSVKVDCVADEVCLKIKCTIKWDLSILISSKFRGKGNDERVQVGAKGVTALAVYGHEQIHLTSLIDAVNKKDSGGGTFFKDIEHQENRRFKTLADCQTTAKTWSIILSDELRNKVFPKHNTNRGGPPDGVGLPPLDNVWPGPPQAD